jgi:hypothetical protein
VDSRGQPLIGSGKLLIAGASWQAHRAIVRVIVDVGNDEGIVGQTASRTAGSSRASAAVGSIAAASSTGTLNDGCD